MIDTNNTKEQDRLTSIIELADNSEVLADIGCDHGKVGYELLKNGVINKLIATDISEACLSKSNLLLNEEFKSCYEGRVGDGLRPIELGEADTAVIAGMGGELIKKIVTDDIEKTLSIKTFIIQPMTDAPLVRECFYNLGYTLVVDKIVCEKSKFYFVMKFEKNGELSIEDDFEFPYSLKRDNPVNFERYIQNEIAVKEAILKSMEDVSTEKAMQTVNRLHEDIEHMREKL